MFRIRSRIVRAAAIGVTAILALTALTSCAGSGGGGGNGGSATSGTINWWSWTPDNDVAARVIALFNKQYPNIKVNYKIIQDSNYTAVLRPALASSNGPDTFTLATNGTAGQVNIFAPYTLNLTSKVQALLGADWKSKVYGVASYPNGYTYQGKLTGMPWGRMTNGTIWIDVNLFKKYNVKVPTTLPQWVAACKVFQAHGHGCLTEGVGDGSGFDITTLHTIMNSVEPGLFTKITTGKAQWTDPAVLQSWAIFKEMQNDGILDPGSVGTQQYPQSNNNFLSGKDAMVQMGYWYAQYATNASLTAALAGAGVPANTPKITIEPIPFPDVAGKGNAFTMFGDPDVGQAVNAKSPVRNAATTFALWIGGTKQAQQLIADNIIEIPTLAGVTPNWASTGLIDPSAQMPGLEWLYKLSAGTTEPRFANLPPVKFTAVSNANVAVVTGKQTPAQAAAAVQQAFNSATG